MLRLAREMIAAGEPGDIRGYRDLHIEDYMADAGLNGPFATIRRAATRWPQPSSCWARSPRSWAIASP